MVKVKLNQIAFEVALSRKNLSQRDFAEKIGFSRSHLSHIINGRITLGIRPIFPQLNNGH